jgi:transposase-like protein
VHNITGYDDVPNAHGQHFLLSTAARTLSLAKVMRMSDDEAFATFKAIRWASTEGDPVCPRCGCVSIYELSDNRRFKCAACYHKFSVTSGTIFASRKMAIRDLLAAIAIFVNGAKGYAALHLSRDLDCQYKTAFVLLHKLREALSVEQSRSVIDGEVAVDGAYFGGYMKPANRKENRVDRRLAENQTGKRRVVIVARELDGETVTHVAKSEAEGVPFVLSVVGADSTIHADEASHWDALHARFLTKRINHSEAYSTAEACTNMAESFFSRLRRAEVGTHHHIAGPYLNAYASEMAWREDHRRTSNGEQYLAVTAAALGHPVSRQWKGYWQRKAA